MNDEKKPDNFLMTYGLIGALVAVLYFVGLYISGTTAFTSFWGYFSYAIPIIIAVIAPVMAKKEQSYLEFRDALKLSFGVLVLSTFSTTVFGYFLFNYIDTAFAESMLQLTIQKTQETMEKFKVPQEEIDKTIKGILTTNIYAFGSMMKNFLFSCIFNFLIALIISAIVKKSKPEFD